ncbi:MAG: RagB/SusD family nutrient uptake outer membrane protein [Flavobacteriaceae bacterium]|nr:RagB/SusD family nutrient uptake outer membrane protein [Flavobacteriaceae bacterium]
MKNIFKLLILIVLIFASCDTDFLNVNQPAEDQVLTTKSGLITVAVGMTNHFTTSTMSPIVEISGLSTRELGNLLTYVTPGELVAGGSGLPNDNAGITRLWNRLLRDKGAAESILSNVDDIEMDPGTNSGLKAYAKFFKAMTLGYLIQNFEKAPIVNSSDGNATFGSRSEVLSECINLLSSASADISANPISDEFLVYIQGMDLPNMINAYLARYNLFAENYDAAISAANLVDLSSMSVWLYDGATNKNAVFVFAVENDPDTKPQDNFGLIGSLIPEINDGRIAFYLSPSDEVEVPEFGGHGVENLKGFFEFGNQSIPVYLPGEILLIKAEAFAMNNDLANAIVYINQVRQKNNDVFGVNANLDAWTGDVNDKDAIMDEIFRNRSIELFMSGLRLEDSRRIHSDFVPNQQADYLSERNRNFYPFPAEERFNNPNTPADPSI